MTNDRSDVDRVKDASDIVRIIGEHVKLVPSGREYKCLCPFHDDHNPSMNVVPSKQMFHCFVCGTGGDVLGFVQKFHKMDFPEAMEYLAGRAGITLVKKAPTQSADGGADFSRDDLRKANETAAQFYRAILHHAEHGVAARAVVLKRGISDEMSQKFMLGAAPDRWDGLAFTVNSRKLDPRLFEQAGLLKARDGGGGNYDVLRNRLIFPIHDRAGRVVAFGGRRLNDEDNPKYLNSPETRLFKKSATLYALNHASRDIQQRRTALITEGYMDVIACHQAGFTHAVATLGTALTREHANELSRVADRVILLFDGDDAGQRAADRSVEIFFNSTLDVRIATLNKFTDAKDPDELLKREGGSAVFQQVLDQSVDLLEFRFARLRARLQGAGLSALSSAIDQEIGTLVDLGLRDVPPIRRTLIIKRLAELAGVDEATIRAAIPAGRSPGYVRVTEDGAIRPDLSGEGDGGDGGEDGELTDEHRQEEMRRILPILASAPLPVSEHLLGCVLCDGDLWLALPREDRDLIEPAVYRSTLVAMLAQIVVDVADRGESPDLAHILRETGDDSLRTVAVGLASRVDRETDRHQDRLSEHWRACLAAARRDRAKIALSSPPSPSAPAPTAPDNILARMQIKRSLHANLGKDPRVLPKPNTVPSGATNRSMNPPFPPPDLADG